MAVETLAPTARFPSLRNVREGLQWRSFADEGHSGGQFSSLSGREARRETPRCDNTSSRRLVAALASQRACDAHCPGNYRVRFRVIRRLRWPGFFVAGTHGDGGYVDLRDDGCKHLSDDVGGESCAGSKAAAAETRSQADAGRPATTTCTCTCTPAASAASAAAASASTTTGSGAAGSASADDCRPAPGCLSRPREN
jgi:hypothetical protein